MEDSIDNISHQIEQQFPSLYQKEGAGFIAFVKAYYEWMEQENGITPSIRSLLDNFDIDRTADRFLEHFKNTYMAGLPAEITGNQRLLQKHILDLYRTKNSRHSLELLFRLLYNESMQLYIPSRDIFRASDGKRRVREYLEVEFTEFINLFDGKEIYGSVSGARADVVGIEVRLLSNVQNVLLFVENIRGAFINSENIYYDEARTNSLRIRGSVNGFTITSSSPNWELGDQVYMVSNTAGVDFKGTVSNTYLLETGTIVPFIVDGGYGFSNETIITTAQGENTSGFGAEFSVGDIINTIPLTVTDYKVADYANVVLGSTDFGFNPNLQTNLNSEIYDAVDCRVIQIGTIATLIVENPGFNYDAPIVIHAEDKNVSKFLYTEPFGYANAGGPVLGNNAIIDDYAAFGQGIAGGLAVKQSGFGYFRGGNSHIRLRNADNNKFISGNFTFGAKGNEEGVSLSDDSFVSATKRLQDSYYYQEYSYEVRSSKSLSHYAAILKAVAHPAGNQAFGAIKVTSVGDTNMEVLDNTNLGDQGWFFSNTANYTATDVFDNALKVPVLVGSFRRNLYAISQADAGAMELDSYHHLRGMNESATFEDIITFTRSTTASYISANGSMQYAAINTPRFDYTNGARQLLIEGPMSNLVLNSAVGTSQDVIVTAAPHSLSFYGTGTVAVAGAYVGSLVGTGANNRVCLTFTPTAGTVHLTVTGSVTLMQLELGGYMSSYCPSVSTQGFRHGDMCKLSDKASALFRRENFGAIIRGRNIWSTSTSKLIGGNLAFGNDTLIATGANIGSIYSANGSAAFGTGNRLGAFGVGLGSNTSVTSLVGNGGTVNNASAFVQRDETYLGRDVFGSHANGWYDELIVYPFKPTNTSLQTRATAFV